LGPRPLSIVSGISILGALEPSVAYVVETSEGLILIDSGLDSDAGRLKAEMSALGLDWRHVCAILLTHTHGDHSGGAEYLAAATGAKVYAGEGDADVLRAGQPWEAFFSTFYMPDHQPHATRVDIALKGDEVLRFGNTTIRALGTPGHTPGSICYLMERDGLRVLFSGDVIMMLVGDQDPRDLVRKPLGTYSAYLAPRYRGNARDFLATLRKLRTLAVPDLVLPGHPGADSKPPSPCLSQKRWEEILDRGIDDMQTLIARYERDGANFLDGNPKRLLPNLYYLGDFRGTAIYGLLAGSKFLLVGAPGGPGLIEYLERRLGELGIKKAQPAAVLLTSCDTEATVGLRQVVEAYKCQVVAGAAGRAQVEELCPKGTVIISAEDLRAQGWFDVTAVPLRGRGLAPLAYKIGWEGKTVLFSGAIPIKPTQESGVRLFKDFMNERGNPGDYLASLVQLRSVQPDLWLPSHPEDGQNANLYGNEWQHVIEDNVLGVNRNLRVLRRAR
jgi:glyoxylase-like metal-dependent hydrolase (beta-lactamase superfamily II)